jgi:hypothetical protein
MSWTSSFGSERVQHQLAGCCPPRRKETMRAYWSHLRRRNQFGTEARLRTVGFTAPSCNSFPLPLTLPTLGNGYCPNDVREAVTVLPFFSRVSAEWLRAGSE